MAYENQKLNKFTREYTGHEPETVEVGPTTFILDTIVLPIVREDTRNVENNGR